MANMGYCRFENTYSDLLDCYDELNNNEKLSDSEQEYKERLIELCKSIAFDHMED